MPTPHSFRDGELSLSEMLSDPIVRAVMERDGVTKVEIEGLLHSLGRPATASGAGADKADRR
jgi:hypothetical protein